MRWLESDNPVEGRGAAHRATRIGPETELREHRGESCACSTGGARRAAREIVRIKRLATRGAGAVGHCTRFKDRGIRCTAYTASAAGKFVKIDLGKNDGASVT